MKTVIVPRGRSLIEEVCASLSGDGIDYSSCLVVFPGKRPAHFLRKALAQQIGSSYIPPRILSMDEFVDLLFDAFDFRRKIETMDAIAILYRIHREAPGRLGGEGFMTPDSFFPLGLRIFRDIEELTIEKTDRELVRELASLMTDEVPDKTRRMFQSLSLFYEGFYQEAAAAGFSTRSERYAAAAGGLHKAGIGQYSQIIFSGFFALTRAEKDLFEKISSLDNVSLFFQEGAGLKEKLSEAGIRIDYLSGAAAMPDIRFYSSPDSHGQVLALGAMLEKLSAAEGVDERTVVVLPSAETLFPLMRQGLSCLPDDGYNISLGYPLFRTPVFGFLNSLMELAASMDGDRVYVPDYLKFVLHPYTKNVYFRGSSEITRILFHTLEEELLKQRMRTFATLAEIEESAIYDAVIQRLPRENEDMTPQSLREHLRTVHRSTIGKFLSFGNIGDFASRCIDVILYISDSSTARMHPLFYPFSEALVTSLEQLGRSLMKEISFTESTSYFTFFRKSMAACCVPFSGTPVRGLQVLGLLETRSLKFERVFVLDANEDILPDTRKEETLLPLKARERLGLFTYADRDRLAAYYFDSLLGGCREAHLFFLEDDRKEKSRFVEKLLWERQKENRTCESGSLIRPLQYHVKLTNRMPEAVGKSGPILSFLRDFQFSASALNDYLKCPLLFCYSWLLRINRKEEISGDIERMGIGTFVHEVLRLFFSEREGKVLRESDIDACRMDSLVSGLFEKEFGRDVSGAAYLLKQQIRTQMSELLRKYYLPLVSEQKVTVLKCERRLKATISGFRLKGRPDSIEQRDNRTVIVDYKTGASKAPLRIDLTRLDPDRRETWNSAIGSLQLPFYILLYAEKEDRLVQDLDALFLLIGRSGISRDIELPLFGPASADEVFAPLRRVIFGLMEEITDAGIPFAPPYECRKACPGCDFQCICGTQWIEK